LAIPWISVLEPGSTKVRVLLIYNVLEFCKVALKLVGHQETRSTGTDGDHAQRPLLVDGLGKAQRGMDGLDGLGGVEGGGVTVRHGVRCGGVRISFRREFYMYM
jgi:hypothetical protein